MNRNPTDASFLRDVATHEMTVLRDDGIYRHIKFCKPDSWNMGFNITTWPGYLCFSGDMGCYVFSRLPDMFVFFRQSDHTKPILSINPSYWGEKVQAVDRNGDLMEFSEDAFKEAVYRWLDDAEASPEVREAVQDEVLSMAGEGEHEAMKAAMEFEHKGFQFDTFYEAGVREYTYRFLWCCYAVAWAVRTYDGALTEVR